MSTFGLIEASPTEVASGQQYQRETFTAHGLAWAIVALQGTTGEHLAVSTSDDGGETWTTPTTFVEDFAGGVGSYGTAAHFDGQYVHVVVSGQGPITMRYRRGEPQANGTIVWDDLQDVLTAVGLAEVDITTNADGYPIIGYEHFNDLEPDFPRAMVTMSAANDGTWTTASGFPFRVDPSAVFNWIGVGSLGGDDVLAIWWSDGVGTKARLWDGSSWGSVEGEIDDPPLDAAVTGSDNAFITDPVTGRAWFVWTADDGTVYCRERDPVGGWQTAEQVTLDPAETLAVGLNPGTGDLYVFYVESFGFEVKYAVRSGGTWDGGGNVLWDVTNDGYGTIVRGSLQVSERANEGQFVLLYQGDPGFGIGGVHGGTLEVQAAPQDGQDLDLDLDFEILAGEDELGDDDTGEATETAAAAAAGETSESGALTDTAQVTTSEPGEPHDLDLDLDFAILAGQDAVDDDDTATLTDTAEVATDEPAPGEFDVDLELDFAILAAPGSEPFDLDLDLDFQILEVPSDTPTGSDASTLVEESEVTVDLGEVEGTLTDTAEVTISLDAEGDDQAELAEAAQVTEAAGQAATDAAALTESASVLTDGGHVVNDAAAVSDQAQASSATDAADDAAVTDAATVEALSEVAGTDDASVTDAAQLTTIEGPAVSDLAELAETAATAASTTIPDTGSLSEAAGVAIDLPHKSVSDTAKVTDQAAVTSGPEGDDVFDLDEAARVARRQTPTKRLVFPVITGRPSSDPEEVYVP